MRRLPSAWLAAVLTVVACGGSSSSGPCPGGATLKGAAPPDGERQWCARSDGTKHGPWKEWHANGQLKVDGYFENGKMERRWTFFNEGGTTIQTGDYEGGLKNGVWTEWEAEGVRKKDTIFDGSSRSTWTVYRPEGQVWAEGSTISAHFDGPYREYHANGQLAAQGTFRKNERVGEWKYWTPDGEPTDEPQGDLDQDP